MFLCEGTHLVQEAIVARWPLEAVCFTGDWQASNADLLRRLAPQVRRQAVSTSVLNHLATTEHPDGVIAVARFKEREPTIETATLALGLDAIQEPGNLGTLIRTAVATRTESIALSPNCVDRYNAKVLRASAGQCFRQSIVETPIIDWIDDCRSRGMQILAAAAGGRSYWEIDLMLPTVFLLGNEGAGLSEEVRQQADQVVSVPMAQGVESLNVATTGSLLLYEAMRQRRSYS